MVGHQHVGMHPAGASLGVLAQPVELAAIVLVSEEARLPIVAALDHVHRHVGQHQTGAARHGGAPRAEVRG